jgi:hypothetical protein
VNDNDETQPPENNMDDEAGAAQDMHPDDPGKQVLGLTEMRTMSKYMC